MKDGDRIVKVWQMMVELSRIIQTKPYRPDETYWQPWYDTIKN